MCLAETGCKVLSQPRAVLLPVGEHHPALAEAKLLGIARGHGVSGPGQRFLQGVQVATVVDRDFHGLELDVRGLALLGHGCDRLLRRRGAAHEKGEDGDDGDFHDFLLFMFFGCFKLKGA
jgi:hypothetical protein